MNKMFWMPLWLLCSGILLLIGCGKSGGKSPPQTSNNSTVITSSSQHSSQASAASLIKFIYPTQKAHIGGATKTQLVVKSIFSPMAVAVDKISI
jgi:hypothetical protein